MSQGKGRSQDKSVIQEKEIMGYRHIGAQDRSQVIWQSSDRGITGSGDREVERKRKGKR